MSWKATAATKQLTHDRDGKKLSAREKLLLFVLADSTDPHSGVAWPSQPLLAKQSLSGIRTVRRLLGRLEGRGLIEIMGSGGRGGHQYRLTYVPEETGQDGRISRPVKPAISDKNAAILSRKAATAMAAEPQSPTKSRIKPPPIPTRIRNLKERISASESYLKNPRLVRSEKERLAADLEKYRTALAELEGAAA